MVDPRTPVIVGVGQFTERIDDADYRGMSAVELATEAVRAALADTGAGGVATAIDTVYALRQFEISGPMPAALGKSNNYPRSVMQRVGGDPARVVLEPVGGQSPQKLVTEAGNTIVAGEADVVMIMGSEPGSTARYFADRDDKPDFTEHIEGQLEDRGHQIFSYIDDYTIQHGLTGAPVQYGLLENARRARLELSVADYRREMAELFAPLSKVAAKNPFSSSPVERSVEEIITVTGDNRMICDPYPRLLVARDQVNQGAAAIMMSVEAARRLGVPEDNWVYVHGHSDMVEQATLDRADLGASPASVLAVREALRVAGIGVDDIATFDLYSCFPFPVFVICEALGIDGDWRPAVLRRPGQQLLTARNRRDSERNAPGARTIRLRRGQRRHHEQVLRRHLLHTARRMAHRPQRSAEARDRRAAESTRDTGSRRHRDHRDLLGALRLADPHRDHRRPPRRRQQPIHGHHGGRRSGRVDVRR
jgi:acetyl-CoA C-acetyltransferase